MDFSAEYEVLIVGGGPAGLMAAMTLGRMRRSVLLCDDQRPRNAPSEHINNFPGRDGIHPARWREEVQDDLKKYKTVKIQSCHVTKIEKIKYGFAIETSEGTCLQSKKVILAHGVTDVMPPISGFPELWGKRIFHCPFCHGYEIQGAELGLIVNNEISLHSLPLIHSLATKFEIFTNGSHNFSTEQLEKINRNRIPLNTTGIEAIDVKPNGKLQMTFNDQNTKELDYIFYAPSLPFTMKAALADNLGCEKNAFGFYNVDMRGATSVPGVFACGDSVSMAHSVLLAAASGVTAGAGAVFDLLNENFS